MKKYINNLSRYIYRKILPIYIPSVYSKYRLAVWCCIDVKKSGDLFEVLKGTRVTIRKDGSPIFVIKKGES